MCVRQTVQITSAKYLQFTYLESNQNYLDLNWILSGLSARVYWKMKSLDKIELNMYRVALSQCDVSALNGLLFIVKHVRQDWMVWLLRSFVKTRIDKKKRNFDNLLSSCSVVWVKLEILTEINTSMTRVLVDNTLSDQRTTRTFIFLAIVRVQL